MEGKSIYIVASFTDTVPGRLIKTRAKITFWNRHFGDYYSHISLSRDNVLDNMMSFARRKIDEPLNAGLVKEDIREGLFSLNKKSEMAVMKLDVSEDQYTGICNSMEKYWGNKGKYNFNFPGMISLILTGRVGMPSKDNFFCSEWSATVLKENGIELFGKRRPCSTRPFDFCCALKKNVIYEGLISEYPSFINGEKIKNEVVSNKKESVISQIETAKTLQLTKQRRLV